MKPDLYTKAVLTIIALLLAVVALKPLITPDKVSAQNRWANIEMTYNYKRNVVFWDKATGDIWEYKDPEEVEDKPLAHWHFTTLGEPPQYVKGK